MALDGVDEQSTSRPGRSLPATMHFSARPRSISDVARSPSCFHFCSDSFSETVFFFTGERARANAHLHRHVHRRVHRHAQTWHMDMWHGHDECQFKLGRKVLA